MLPAANARRCESETGLKAATREAASMFAVWVWCVGGCKAKQLQSYLVNGTNEELTFICHFAVAPGDNSGDSGPAVALLLQLC
jgi:hypothetical protein